MVNVHIMSPAEEQLVSLTEPFDGVIGNDFSTYVGSWFALHKLVRLLDGVCDVEDVIDAAEFGVVYFNSSREDFRSDSHQWILKVFELVVSYVIIKMVREEGIALERTGGTASFSETGTHSRPGFSERAKSPVRKR
jgi:hypothetical protein